MDGAPIGGDSFVCDDDKYFWVQAETLATAALMAKRTGDDRYWQWYERIWAYAWEHFVDHQFGAWFRILDADNRKYSDEEPGRQGGLPHHGRVLRSVERGALRRVSPYA